jgi:hypothetical protein
LVALKNQTEGTPLVGRPDRHCYAAQILFFFRFLVYIPEGRKKLGRIFWMKNTRDT